MLATRRGSLHVCEAAQVLAPDLFGAALTLGSILVDLGELEMHAVDHAVPTLDHGVVICIPELIDHVLIDLDRLELGVDRRGRRFEGVLLLEVGAVARSSVGSSVVEPVHAVNARDRLNSHQRGHMSSTKDPGRFAGLLYVLMSIPGFFALIYVPSKLIVHGNAAATANNIAASETLSRLGIACNLISQAGFIFVALALYDLLKEVNQRHAVLMVTLIVVAIPIAFLNELNAIAALVLVRGVDFLSIFEKPQRDALAMLFLNLHSYGFDIAGIFWGLWLFPLGLLVYRSGFVPRILGILLVLNGFTYPVNSFTSLLLPQYEHIVSRWMTPLGFGELVFMFWLLIKGAKPKPHDCTL
jgi:hypothetical protein